MQRAPGPIQRLIQLECPIRFSRFHPPGTARPAVCFRPSTILHLYLFRRALSPPSYRWYPIVDPVRHESQPIQQVLVPRSQGLEAGIALRLPHRWNGLVKHTERGVTRRRNVFGSHVQFVSISRKLPAAVFLGHTPNTFPGATLSLERNKSGECARVVVRFNAFFAPRFNSLILRLPLPISYKLIYCCVGATSTGGRARTYCPWPLAPH